MPSISGDASTVAFWSKATNFIPDDANGVQDIYIVRAS
jgi:hypothetical protein